MGLILKVVWRLFIVVCIVMIGIIGGSVINNLTDIEPVLSVGLSMIGFSILIIGVLR